jgi:4-alpha-glucanotransferase
VWGFPPLHPDAIRKSGYRYWIDCLRHQFRHAAALRIDHVMGLHRLFWVPNGMEAAEGVYVRYQAEELYAILCLESRRCQTAVMGENLGTVPAYVSAAMSRHGVQKMYVGQHEGGPARRHPLRLVPRDAVASLNTHDMAPFAAFLSGADLEDMQRLGLFGAAEVRQGKSRRRAIQHALAEFFHTKRFLARKSAETGELFKAFLEWLAASPARLVLVNLEDLWLETLPQNVPGTSDERPNWRRKARYALEEFSRRRAVVEMLQRLSELRRLPPGRS